jgi:hypothetical protein
MQPQKKILPPRFWRQLRPQRRIIETLLIVETLARMMIRQLLGGEARAAHLARDPVHAIDAVVDAKIW